MPSSRPAAALIVALAVGVMACGDEDARSDDDDDGSSSSATAAGGSGAGGDATGGAATGGNGSGAGPGSGGAGAGSSGGAGTGGEIGTGGSGGSPPTGCAADGLALIDAIYDYRGAKGVGPIPASTSLCIVADTHVNDLRDNAPHAPSQCNLHSWSDQGPWSACCYTADHAQAQCMWDKPGELTVYSDNGFEISYGGSNDPNSAVSAWSQSSGHNAVILNQGSWSIFQWQAIGAAQEDGYAHVWVGASPDPAP